MTKKQIIFIRNDWVFLKNVGSSMLDTLLEESRLIGTDILDKWARWLMFYKQNVIDYRKILQNFDKTSCVLCWKIDISEKFVSILRNIVYYINIYLMKTNMVDLAKMQPMVHISHIRDRNCHRAIAIYLYLRLKFV